MPVVVASASRSAHALISYALDDKADQQGERYVMASGVGGLLVSVAKQQMRDVRKKWGKDRPGAFVQAYHVIESFAKDELDPEDPDSWMTAQKLGRALAEDRFPGRQALIVTQRDGKTGCVHNHLVVNSIETKTGRSLDSSIVMHARLVEAHERVLEAEGFEQRADLKQAFSDAAERMERGEHSSLRRAGSSQRSELREFQRYIMWEAENDIADEFGAAHKPEPFSTTILKGCIEQALADPAATDWAGFVAAGRVHGVDIVQRGRKGRGISYGMLRRQADGTVAEPSASDRRRCSSLGIAVQMDAVEQALKRNGIPQPGPPTTMPVAAAVVPPGVASDPEEPKRRMQSAKERMQAALDQADEDANSYTRRLVADYVEAKASTAEPQTRDETLDHREQTEGDSILAKARFPQPQATGHKQQRNEADLVPTATANTQADKTTSATKAAAPALQGRGDEGQGLSTRPPQTSDEPSKAIQEAAAKQRERRRKYPELFEDVEVPTNPREPGQLFGD